MISSLNYETNLMSLINPSLENIYCSITVAITNPSRSSAAFVADAASPAQRAPSAPTLPRAAPHVPACPPARRVGFGCFFSDRVSGGDGSLSLTLSRSVSGS